MEENKELKDTEASVLAGDLTIDQIKALVAEKIPFAAQHPVTEDYEIAEKLQIMFEQGRILTVSLDGSSAHDSHMGRSGPIQLNGDQLWCHSVLLIGDTVVDLWHQPSVVTWEKYWEKVCVENMGTQIRVFDEDAAEEVTDDVTGMV